jgi:hypothetical protein
MSRVEAIVGIALGIVTIYVGLATRGPFYARGPGQRPTPKSKTWPKWLGQLWFCAVGCAFLYWGISALLHHPH